MGMHRRTHSIYSLGDKNKTLSGKITEYLSAGGLNNPELMDHNKVRDLLIEIGDDVNYKLNWGVYSTRTGGFVAAFLVKEDALEYAQKLTEQEGPNGVTYMVQERN